jgi:hypothetical protein
MKLVETKKLCLRIISEPRKCEAAAVCRHTNIVICG